MCGIAGFAHIQYDTSEVHQYQRHRGEDHQGSFNTEHLSLYHQRLAIIELGVAGNQPFEKDGYVVMFNGEIYNYPTLRHQLKAHWYTSTESEVIIEYFKRYRTDCFSFFEGMFAIVIYEKSTQKLYLARDTQGIKPLYYQYFEDKSLAFASEMRTLYRICPQKPTLRSNILEAFLLRGWSASDATIFEGIEALPAGSCLSYAMAEKTLKITTYRPYIPTVPQPPPANAKASSIIEYVEKELLYSINKHCLSDVPIGTLLSGGIDSSLVAAMASQAKTRHHFCLALPKEDLARAKMPDDYAYAKILNQHLGASLVATPLNSKEFIEMLPLCVAQFDEPNGDPAAVATWLISKKAKQEYAIRVLLSGLGADELFFGYRRQKALLYYPLGHWLAKIGLLPWVAWGINNKSIEQVFNAPTLLDALKMAWQKEFFKLPEIPEENRMLNLILEQYQGIKTLNEVEWQSFLRHNTLKTADFTSMANGLEIRVPYVDTILKKRLSFLPDNYYIRQGIQKYILRRIAEKYLPEAIIQRPKVGFGFPLSLWLQHHWSSIKAEIFSPFFLFHIAQHSKALPWLAPLLQTIKQQNTPTKYPFLIYRCLVFHYWLRSL
ncbi:MAG: asparagine synthase (glutamine-hydrolyzing) [Cytophagales bacterium]|nr:MAG: asparagine synthase (glutamine-hydrolyzing) [Cytophagales bacterium]